MATYTPTPLGGAKKKPTDSAFGGGWDAALGGTVSTERPVGASSTVPGSSFGKPQADGGTVGHYGIYPGAGLGLDAAGGSTDFDENTGLYRSTGAPTPGGGTVGHYGIRSTGTNAGGNPQFPQGIGADGNPATGGRVPEKPGSPTFDETTGTVRPSTPTPAPFNNRGTLPSAESRTALALPTPQPHPGGLTPRPNAQAPSDLMDPWTEEFSFDGSSLGQDPGYQFRQQEAAKALERSAAARGTLLTGGTAKALTDRAQLVASDETQNAFNRALSTFGTNFDTAMTDKSRRSDEFARGFDRERANRTDSFGEDEAHFNRNRATRLDTHGIEQDYFTRDRTLDMDDFTKDEAYWNRGRSENLDAWTRDDNLWERGRTEMLDEHGIDTDYWNRDRTTRLDEHGIDQDYWTRGRTEQMDAHGIDQDYWTRDYQLDRDYTQNLFNYAGMGYGAARDIAYLGAEYGRNAGGTMEDQGNADAAGAVGGWNQWAEFLEDAAGRWLPGLAER